MENSINIIDNLIEAISILNKTDEYLENLGDRLSECDQLKSDFEHIIEIYKMSIYSFYLMNFRKTC